MMHGYFLIFLEFTSNNSISFKLSFYFVLEIVLKISLVDEIMNSAYSESVTSKLGAVLTDFILISVI
jgi:hypothetical protein